MFGACNYVICIFGLWRSIRLCMYGAWIYMVGSFGLCRSIRVYVWCMEFYGRQFWCMEVNPSSIEVKLVYVWCMELCGRQFWSMEVNPGVCLVDGITWYAILVCRGQPGCLFGAWNYMVGSFGVCRSIRVYVWCMELDVRQFWSMEVNPGVCLVHGIMRYSILSIEVNPGVCLVHGIIW